MKQNGNPVTINWLCNEDDKDMQELVQQLEQAAELQFEKILGNN